MSHDHAQEGITLDLRMAKEIAEAVARTAAIEVAHELREEMRMENKRLREELLEGVRKEIQTYHGDMTPTEHALQHARMDRFLGFMDRTSQNIWTQLMKAVVSAVLFLFLLGYFLWHQGVGNSLPGVSQ